MRSITWMGAFIVSTTILSGNAAAQLCTRHFYNNSPTVWSVDMMGQGSCDGRTHCDIGPGQTATIRYFGMGGRMQIISNFYNKTFGTVGCYIMHSGSTGAIAVNDPADGDVKTCGRRDWPCAKYGYRRP